MEERLDVLGCSYCLGSLQLADDSGIPLHCEVCQQSFSVEGRVPVLVRREDTTRLPVFSEEFRIAYLPQVPHFPIQGNLECPPLQTGTLGLVLFNASLHYAADLEGTVRDAAEALRARGQIIVPDTPATPQPRPGTGRGDRHLGARKLHLLLIKVGVKPRWIEGKRGWRWWAHPVKAALRREPRFSIPMISACRSL